MTLYELDRKLENTGYKYSHTSTLSGYVSRKKEFEVKPYVGKFGIGVKVLTPRYDSSRYIWCSYYILKCNPNILSPERLYVEFKNGNKYDYDIIGYCIGKYDINLALLGGYGIVLKKSLLKNIITKGVKEICDLTCSNQ